MPNAPSVKWTREHLLMALNLYCKLPFGKFHRLNPIIIAVAQKMGRTPNSLAMKLSNFASLDPVQKARGIKGLEGASKQDRIMWDEFHNNLSTLAPASEQLLHDLFTKNDEREVDFLEPNRIRLEPSRRLTPPSGPTQSKATVRVRRGQQFFRQTILNTYGIRCCISGISIPDLLVASHIKPWSICTDKERLDPQNGLCLSALHDAAFDGGLITLDERFRLVLSKHLKSYLPQPALKQNFVAYEGKAIRLPEKLAEPAQDLLEYHRTTLFVDARSGA
jgi:putative restriction endonuclease